MLYTFNDATSPSCRPAVLRDVRQPRYLPPGLERGDEHHAPWLMVGGDLPPFDEDVWELYDGSNATTARLATSSPTTCARCWPGCSTTLTLIEATKYNVLLMDDRTRQAVGAVADRPTDPDPRDVTVFFPGMGRLSENSVVSIRTSRSPSPLSSGPRGGARCGHRPGWAVRWLGALCQGRKGQVRVQRAGDQEFATDADEPIPSGTHQVRMEFAYDGGGLAKGGNVTLYHDGKVVGTGRVGATQPMIFSADETTDIGYGVRHHRYPRLHRPRQPVHRQDHLGADRSRHRRQRPLHRPRGAATNRHGPSVADLAPPRPTV